jgi:signal transduction histidine kinase
MFSKITNRGVSNSMSSHDKRRQILANNFYLLAFAACLINLIDLTSLGANKWILISHFFVSFIPLVLYYLNKYESLRKIALDLFILIACTWIFLNASIFGPKSGIQYFYFPTLLFLFILIKPNQVLRLVFFTLLIISCFLLLEITKYSLFYDSTISENTIKIKYYIVLFITLTQTILASYYMVKVADKNETLLEFEKNELFIVNSKLDELNSFIEKQNDILKTELQLKTIELLTQQKELNIALLEAEEKERKRLSRDLHDGLGLLLSTAKIKIQTVDYSNLARNENLSEALELIDKSCIELRLISQNLTPTLLSEIGIVASLDAIINSINSSKFTNIEFISVGVEKIKWKGEDEVKIYRLILELINNCVKHSNAKMISVQLIYKDKQLQIFVEDNGIGFKNHNNNTGNGIKNMRAIVELFNGQHKIESRENSGTLILIHLPYE